MMKTPLESQKEIQIRKLKWEAESHIEKLEKQRAKFSKSLEQKEK